MADNPFYKALAVLMERGWHRGFYVSETSDAVCALGALGVALVGDPLLGRLRSPEEIHKYTAGQRRALWRLEEMLVAETGVVRGGVAAFNDDPSTSFEDLVLVFKHAAVKWEEDQ